MSETLDERRDSSPITSLATPALIVDRSRMMANLDRLRRNLDPLGVRLRPHLKTVKSVEAARLAVDFTTGSATVSTLKEAEMFGAAGLREILYAVGIAPQKLDRVSALRRDGIDLKIIVDSVTAAGAVAAQSKMTGDAIPTLIEVDIDGHRAGVPVSDKGRLIEIARTLTEGGASLAGVMTHAGESYALSDPAALEQASLAEARGTVAMAETLREAGFYCDIVSVGSTPTAFSGKAFDGVTEVRAGVYMFFDLVMAGVGVCSVDDIALSVLATVIGHQKEKGWILTDGGWMAMSRDRGTADQKVDQFYGVVCDETGRPFDDLVVLKASQEQGILTVRPGSSATLPDLPIGARVRILPNHACATAAQYDSYAVLDDDGRVSETWPRFNGW